MKNKTDRHKQLLLHLLKKYGYTDGTDVTPNIALFEYGILRNPKNGHTILTIPSSDEREETLLFSSEFINPPDILENIEDLANAGFWSFIGAEKQEYVERFSSPDFLSMAISDLISYYGYENLGYSSPSMSLEYIIDTVKSVNEHKHLK